MSGRFSDKLWMISLAGALGASSAFAATGVERGGLSLDFSVNPLFAAKNATEAVLTFDHRVHYAHQKPPSGSQARAQIEKQLDHLFGPMAASRFPGAPKEDHRITGVNISGEPGDYVIQYRYAGTMVLGNGASSRYDVLLPKDPEKIYAQAQVKVGEQVTNPCTDGHYQTEGDFWYFWNPYQRGCKLKEGVEYDKVRARVQRIDNTKDTYPEYDRMADSDGVIRISVLLGMDDATQKKNPMNSDDVNADNYRGLRQELVKMGFSVRRLSKDEIHEIVPSGTSPMGFVEEFEKKNARAALRVQLFFGPSQIVEQSGAFHYFFKDALENSAVMIYDGHSGLGGNLDLSSIENTEGFKIKPKKDKYQVYFFNSCSSYTYYNTMFFGKKSSEADKRGTKNLDILANGLETAFDVMHDTNMVLIQSIDAWSSGGRGLSYQEIARKVDSDNLFTVNGDEDNPTSVP